MVFGDFNLEPTNPVMINFMNSQNFTNLIKNNTCFKGVGSCIDLILTNRKYCFKNTSSYETGISDHHHLIFSIMKTTFASEEPKKFVYRDYKTFSHENFKNDLLSKTVDENADYSKVEREFIDTLNKHAPKKTKLFRGNQKPLVNKVLRSAIMKRSRLKNKANKTRKAVDIFNYKKQRNLVVKINNECKREYFDKLNVKTTTKPFWKACKPYFSNKHSHGGSKITLIENDRIIPENNKMAKTFNTYFGSVTDPLNLFDWIGESVNSNDKIEQILFKFSKHPSVLKIKQKIKINSKFSFQSVSEDTVKNVVKNLPSDKATAAEIPVDILKNSEFCFSELTKCINEAFNENKFPDTLKLSDIMPVFKKLDPTDKTSFRPVSVLPLLSKVFEKIMYDQLYEYAETFLNKLLCGFRKAHSTQHALFRLLQK